MNLKNLNKKIRRLGTKIEKDTKKLAKLRLKLTRPPKKKHRSSKKTKPTAAGNSERGIKMKSSSKTAAKSKTKRTMSDARRAQLAEAMKARWAAKRAAATSTSNSPPAAETQAA
jgi:hypothetical protein